MPRLIPTLRSALRDRNYSPHTARAYIAWTKRYVHYCALRHPDTCGESEVRGFLAQLAERRRASVSTQHQARSALQFLYREVVGRPLTGLATTAGAARSAHTARSSRLPPVLSPDEVSSVLAVLPDEIRDVVALLYGAGLRLEETLALRIMDLDLARRVVIVRAGVGATERRTVLPESLVESLRRRVEASRRQHLRDTMLGADYIPLPDGVDGKRPAARAGWRWTWLFPARRTVREPRTGHRMRRHLHVTTVQRAITLAAAASGLDKRVTATTFRHSFATQLLRSGCGIRTVQALLGHQDVSTTMLYLRVLQERGDVRSPFDVLPPVRGDTTTPQQPLRGPL